MALSIRNNLRTAHVAASVLTSSATMARVGSNASHVLEPGGQAGRMYAELSARLAGSTTGMAIAPDPKERLVRLVSIAGGYIALAAAYVGVILLMLR